MSNPENPGKMPPKPEPTPKPYEKPPPTEAPGKGGKRLDFERPDFEGTVLPTKPTKLP